MDVGIEEARKRLYGIVDEALASECVTWKERAGVRVTHESDQYVTRELTGKHTLLLRWSDGEV